MERGEVRAAHAQGWVEVWGDRRGLRAGASQWGWVSSAPGLQPQGPVPRAAWGPVCEGPFPCYQEATRIGPSALDAIGLPLPILQE